MSRHDFTLTGNQRMRHPFSRLLTCLALGSMLVYGVGCQPPDSPTLCVFTSTDFTGDNAAATPETFRCDTRVATAQNQKEPAKCNTTIAADSIVYVRHILPVDVIPSGPLQLRVETPCASKDYEVPYAESMALWSSEAPAGSVCSLTITSILDNSELRCSMRGTGADACTNVCPDGVK